MKKTRKIKEQYRKIQTRNAKPTKKNVAKYQCETCGEWVTQDHFCGTGGGYSGEIGDTY